MTRTTNTDANSPAANANLPAADANLPAADANSPAANSSTRWWKKYTSQIVVGLIVCVLYTIIVNISSSLLIAAQNAGTNLYKITVDMIYVQASKVTENTIPQVCYSIIMGMTLGMLIGTLLIILKIHHNIKRGNDIKQRVIKSGFFNSYIFPILNCLLFLMVVLFSYLYTSYPVTLKDDFNLQLEKLRPYIQQQEFWLLRSDWTQITSKSDYKKITERLDALSEQYFHKK